MDILGSLVGLVLFSWLIVLAFAVAAIETGENGFFIQQRIGKNGRRFPLIKIRTMRSCGSGSPVTVDGDSRLTATGRFMRRWKIDEFPQLLNVLVGQMSLVGPRPDVPGFADQVEGEDRLIMAVRPGITGPASLVFRDEERLLAGVDDPEEYNRKVVFPAKVRMNIEYVKRYSLAQDVRFIWLTISGGELEAYP
jgi:lipopolysaccharide/colanic/teichoic acid biosynthesis glycosyltransferase